MVTALSGGPNPVALAATHKSTDLTHGREHARRASVAQAQGATPQPAESAINLGAAYGVPSQLQTQKTANSNQKRRVPVPEDETTHDEAVDPKTPRHLVDVET
ncbi:MAG: hypothetical protein WAZ18_00500 [Alphaproteobacteria bacterium]